MNGSKFTQFTNAVEFEHAVVDADDDTLQLSTEIRGTPMGCDVDTLLTCAERFDDPVIITTAQVDAPVPVGASFEVNHLHDLADLIEGLGSNCIKDIGKREDGSLRVGYHFE